MIEVKTIVNTNNKEEFINKKTLRRRLASHLLTILDCYKKIVDTCGIDCSSGYQSDFVHSVGTAHALGVIDEVEYRKLLSLVPSLSEPIESLALTTANLLTVLVMDLK